MSYMPPHISNSNFNKESKRTSSTPLNNNNDVRFVYTETSPMNGNGAPLNINQKNDYLQFGTVQPKFNPIPQPIPLISQQTNIRPQYESSSAGQSLNYPTSSTQNYSQAAPFFGISTNEASQNVSNFINNPITSYALNYTAFLAKESAEKLNASSGWLDKVRRYFDVDNRYVVKKLIIILFPFLHRDWSCSLTTDSNNNYINDVTPKKNVNFPDLYIPLMAFWTSMVLYASALGYKNMFHPALLSIYLSSCFGMFIFELLFFTMVFYLSGFYERYSLLHMMALCGYKYVAVVEGILAYFAIGSWNFFFLLYVSLMFVLFICKNSRLLLMPGYSVDNIYGGYHHYSHNYNQNNNTKRLVILTIIGTLQPLQIYYSVHKISTLLGS